MHEVWLSYLVEPRKWRSIEIYAVDLIFVISISERLEMYSCSLAHSRSASTFSCAAGRFAVTCARTRLSSFHFVFWSKSRVKQYLSGGSLRRHRRPVGVFSYTAGRLATTSARTCNTRRPVWPLIWAAGRLATNFARTQTLKFNFKTRLI